MKKIIIVGHKSLNFEKIKHSLAKMGVDIDEDTNEKEISANKIFDILYKNHFNVEFEQLEEYVFLNIDKIYNNLILDFLVENKESKLYGWSDSRSLIFLKDWINLDSNCLVIVAYNHPISVLEKVEGDLSEEKIIKEIDNWYSYNKLAKDFYNSYKSKTILLNLENDFDLSFLTENNNFLKKVEKEIVPKNEKFFIYDFFLKNNSKVTDLYNEFEENSINKIEKNNQDFNSLNNLKRFISIENDIKNKIKENFIKKEELDNLKFNFISLQEKYSLMENKFKDLNNIKNEIEKKAIWRQNKIKELTLDLGEKLNLYNALVTEKNDIEKKAVWRQAKIQELNSEIKKLSEKNNNTCGQDKEIMEHKISQLKEEIKYYYHENKELKSNIEKNSNILFNYDDKNIYDVGYNIISSIKYLSDNIKSGSKYTEKDIYVNKDHLSYKIGKVIEKSSKSKIKWIKIPCSMVIETLKFKLKIDK